MQRSTSRIQATNPPASHSDYVPPANATTDQQRVRGGGNRLRRFGPNGFCSGEGNPRDPL
jgi:hypothetical protein